MSMSNPATLPTMGLIVPFILLYGAVLNTVKWLVDYAGRSVQLYASHTIQRKIPAVVTVVLITVLALQSIGQLTVRDLVAVILVVALGYFYVYRNDTRRK